MWAFCLMGTDTSVVALAGGAFGFTTSATANLREKNDYWNETAGGFPCGAIVGLACTAHPPLRDGWLSGRNSTNTNLLAGRLAPVIGYGAFASVLMFTLNVSGGSLQGWMHESDDDVYARKMAARSVRRRPLEETIAEIGEGRGMSALAVRF